MRLRISLPRRIAATMLSLVWTGISWAQIPAWEEKNLSAFVNGEGWLLASDGSVMTDGAGNPLVPDCAFSDQGPMGPDGTRSRGYRFFVQPGDPGKLLLFHDQGGACWDANTCASPLAGTTPTFDPAITETPEQLAADRGILDGSNDANPFKTWTKVLLPYCTGDVGWGNNNAFYLLEDGSTLSVQHRGYANIRGVLRWLEDFYVHGELPPPAKVTFAGISAGAYAVPGTLFPEVVKTLPASTRSYLLVDSGNGIVTDSFLAAAAFNWGINNTLPDYLVPILGDGAQGLPVRFYRELTKRFRSARFGQVQNAFDLTQAFFLNTMKYTDDPTKWTDLQYLLPTLVEWATDERIATSLEALSPNYRYYTSAGTEHVVLATYPADTSAPFCSDDFYTESSAGGLLLRDWVDAMVNGGGVLWQTGNWRNAKCAPDCFVPPQPGCIPLRKR